MARCRKTTSYYLSHCWHRSKVRPYTIHPVVVVFPGLVKKCHHCFRKFNPQWVKLARYSQAMRRLWKYIGYIGCLFNRVRVFKAENSIKEIQLCVSYSEIRFSLLFTALQWRHNGCDGVSHHQPHDCLLNRLLRCRSKETSKLRVIGLCVGNLPVTHTKGQ